ncbi:Hpt domain-containing response regulator [Azohydromonas lata]|uniref:Hpt domain-containing response regulator n=1 Tax=Azohydromonas lata TaxID=45677 RepID=UPI00082ED647|nr:Hpt domain-containing protein [Azohydromonas lata]
MQSSPTDTSHPAPAAQQATFFSGRVLLALHDAEERQQLLHWLQQAGLQVDAVDNGHAAVESLMAEDYGLALLATQLPGMDGVAAMELLTAAGCFTPMLALTAGDTPDDETQRCRGAGCVDVLAWPLDAPRLLAAVERHLHLAQPELSDDELMERELQALLAEFRRTLPSRLAEIESAWRGGDMERLYRLTHTLKGGAGSFGHPEITHICAGMEQAMRDSDAPALQRSCTELRAAVQATARH